VALGSVPPPPLPELGMVVGVVVVVVVVTTGAVVVVVGAAGVVVVVVVVVVVTTGTVVVVVGAVGVVVTGVVGTDTGEVTGDGSPGVLTTTALDGADAGPAPARLRATTLNVYEVPLLRPRTVHVVLVVVHFIPPGRAVAL